MENLTIQRCNTRGSEEARRHVSVDGKLAGDIVYVRIRRYGADGARSSAYGWRPAARPRQRNLQTQTEAAEAVRDARSQMSG